MPAKLALEAVNHAFVTEYIRHCLQNAGREGHGHAELLLDW